MWTIDDAAEMDRLLDLGVDGIMTDRPAVLRDVLTGARSVGALKPTTTQATDPTSSTRPPTAVTGAPSSTSTTPVAAGAALTATATPPA